MTIHANDEPITLLTPDDQRAVADWQEELRQLAVRVDMTSPTAGTFPR